MWGSKEVTLWVWLSTANWSQREVVISEAVKPCVCLNVFVFLLFLCLLNWLCFCVQTRSVWKSAPDNDQGWQTSSDRFADGRTEPVCAQPHWTTGIHTHTHTHTHTLTHCGSFETKRTQNTETFACSETCTTHTLTSLLGWSGCRLILQQKHKPVGREAKLSVHPPLQLCRTTCKYRILSLLVCLLSMSQLESSPLLSCPLGRWQENYDNHWS